MPYKSLNYKKENGMGVITLNRHAVDNSIDIRLAEELNDICVSINHDDDVRVVVIIGAGEKAIRIGSDPKEFSAVVDNEIEFGLMSVATPVASLKCPVIVAIDGDALGQDLEMVLACDIRIAAETAHFALPHIASGFIPWDGATQRLPSLIGKAKAMEMILTGQSIDAMEAYQIGLVSKVVSPEELIPVVMNMAETMATKASWALKYAKEAILNGLDMTLEQGLRLEADLYFLLQTTEDRTEGIKAFLEKRPAEFKGI